MLGNILGIVMKFCYDLVSNYGLAIILFTLISKIVLLPISIWVQKNSIKMVQMQPDINKIKIKYFGDKDSIAEEEAKLYKKYKYSPFASIIPLVIQIVLLLGLVQVINKPMTHILNFSEKETNKYVDVLVNDLKGIKTINPKDSNIEVQVVKDVKKNPSKYYKADTKSNVSKVNDLSFTQAMNILSNKNPEFVPSKQKKQDIKLIMPEKAQSNDKAVKYLVKRGIDKDIIDECISKELIYQQLKYNNVVLYIYKMN